ncbi:hypothetical protein Hanom_Chr03g00214201 [Helianthus anomalus]
MMENIKGIIPDTTDMPAENPVKEAATEFDMIVSLIWFPFRMYILDGSIKFFRVEELVVMEREGGNFECDVINVLL